jgi:hypothetical protein
LKINKNYTVFYILILLIPLLIEHFSNFLGASIKAILIIYFFVNTIKIRKISLLLISFCLFFIFNQNLDFGRGIVFELIQIIYFPVCFFYFFKFSKNKNSLLLASHIISYTIIFSSLFFILKIFNQNELILDQLEVLSSKFEDSDGAFLHFGFFEHPQAASKLYVLSVMIILFKKGKRLIDYLALILGVYLVYITYVRLAWLVLLVSLLLFVLHQKSKRLKLFFLTALSLSFFFVLPLIINRIFNFTEIVTLSSLSSGRNLLILQSILFIQNISFFDMIFGSGYELVMDTIGYAHNRFFEVFIFGGLVSFLLWLAIYKKIFFIIKPFLKGNYLVISILFLILNTMLFSHGFSPYLALLASIAIISNNQKIVF